ncbi:MAG TPA: helix-turn-helix domain-containing protein [Candidatus Brocadiia bacterium]|nr:helix-turn-helix domain-containing protein [Candidatus Brocadiia bacterium]
MSDETRQVDGFEAQDCAGRGAILLTAKEAAALLHVSERHLWGLHNDGRLGPIPRRLGRCIRWSRRELEQWADSGCPCRKDWLERVKS